MDNNSFIVLESLNPNNGQSLIWQEYTNKDREEVKRSTRKDKRNFIAKLASEAEEAAEKSEFSTVQDH